MFCILFDSLLQDCLDYANCVWNRFLQEDEMCLVNVQRWASNLVCPISRLPYETCLQYLNIPT